MNDCALRSYSPLVSESATPAREPPHAPRAAANRAGAEIHPKLFIPGERGGELAPVGLKRGISDAERAHAVRITHIDALLVKDRVGRLLRLLFRRAAAAAERHFTIPL